ncbi:hypothetical protein GGX14DRAFT_581457 [Mycena pura]|uniref:Uncharacterized protein n=1 Tax=Mycena pura TaxID=153505 RepID=A0AAD7E5Y8_9AGAR|nr:hypothetical protein GGX14DRAFT_581457 [Mycena pura]
MIKPTLRVQRELKDSVFQPERIVEPVSASAAVIAAANIAAATNITAANIATRGTTPGRGLARAQAGPGLEFQKARALGLKPGGSPVCLTQTGMDPVGPEARALGLCRARLGLGPGLGVFTSPSPPKPGPDPGWARAAGPDGPLLAVTFGLRNTDIGVQYFSFKH